MDIKVLGSGCKKCNKLLEIVNEIITSESIDANVEKIEDVKAIMSYGVMGTPALVIDGEVIFAGSLPSKKKIKKMIV